MGAIVKRYGRGEDVKLAISAGNDLAMICHQTETAEIAAKAIGELPIWQRDDARGRLDRFRKKMAIPRPPKTTKPKTKFRLMLIYRRFSFGTFELSF